MEVKIKKTHPDAVIPKYMKIGDAGQDLTSVGTVKFTDKYVEYNTGISMEIPVGYVGLVFPRSSISNKDLTLSNAVGVIDSNYRGTITARFKQTVETPEIYTVGERCCQIIIIPVPEVKFVEVEELSDTDRGVGGYGSTGK